MSNLHSGGKFNKFIMGKGFYVALAVCLVGAGAAAWVSVDKTISGIQSAPLAETPPAQSEKSQLAEQKLADIAKEVQDNITKAEAPAAKAEPTTIKEADLSTSPSSPSAQASAPAQSPEPVSQSAAQAQPQASPTSSFALPVNSEVMASFSGDNLVKNVTMNDWRTHNGIDIKTALGTPVNASCDSSVTAIRNDPLWGNVVELTSGSRVAIYSGLSENISVKLGDTVSAGQPIGEVGNIPCELSLEPHLHFMVKESGKYVDPISLLTDK